MLTDFHGKASQSFALWEQRISSKAWALSVVLISLCLRRVSPFLAWGDFQARSRFARSTIPEDKWGTTRSLEAALQPWIFIIKNAKQLKKLSKINFKKRFKKFEFQGQSGPKTGRTGYFKNTKDKQGLSGQKETNGPFLVTSFFSSYTGVGVARR